jgi:SAM-dependent methyltransferase
MAPAGRSLRISSSCPADEAKTAGGNSPAAGGRGIFHVSGKRHFGLDVKSVTETMNEHIAREKDFHGTPWDSVHEGYFSDPSAAAPLVREILEAAGRSKPDVIVDLGGGTGSLLACVREAGVGTDVSLLDLDDSPEQLGAARAKGFVCIRGSLDSFSRNDVIPGSGVCLFIMRSVLHYFGKDGLRPVLRHIRDQAIPGEYFVHQTASFDRDQDAECLNNLYLMMGTRKWYPTVASLRRCLSESGWNVAEICPAPTLRLAGRDLAQRYHLGQEDIDRIRGLLPRGPGVSEEIFRRTPEGFTASLHYRIYVCKAEGRGRGGRFK